MKNVLLLGATGRIGGIVLKNLLPDKAKVRAYVRTPEKLDAELACQIEVIKGDILDPESLGKAMEGMRVRLIAPKKMMPCHTS